MLYGLIPQYADLAREARIDPVLFDELQRDRSDIRIFRTGKPGAADIVRTASAGLRGFDSIVYSPTSVLNTIWPILLAENLSARA